jgi:hypothetical protein
LPALLAHALGWHAIWGSGSVGWTICCRCPSRPVCLHVPSFVLCAIGLWQLPSRVCKGGGSLARAAAWGLALAGACWACCRLDEALLAVRSGSSWSGTLWQENPLALFVLTDATLALLMGAWPAFAAPRRDPVRWLLWLCPGLGVVVLAWQMVPVADAFLPGMVRQGPARGDAQWMVYTGQDMQAAGFELPKCHQLGATMAPFWSGSRRRHGPSFQPKPGCSEAF